MTKAPLPPIPRDPRQPADFDPVALGRELLRSARIGTLATIEDGTGFPFATLTNVASDVDGAPLILVSGLSTHTRNLLGDARVSLLLTKSGQNARAEKGDPLAHPRLTVQARAMRVEDEASLPRLRARFLARHPKAQMYVDFPDFTFFRLEPVSVHLNGGFARAFDGDPRYLTADLEDLNAFAALEAEALAHLNAEHADTLSLYAEKLARRGAGKWRAAALDPHGLDLMLGDEVARIAFAQEVQDGKSLRETLHALAVSARASN